MTGPVGVIGSPHELLTTGGTGTTCASPTQVTVDPSFGGNVKLGGEIVYVYIHGDELPVQSVYVHVYVLVPEQTGSGLMTGPVIARLAPHELFTTGGIGTICALLIHATVELPAAGSANVGGLIVYVYVHCAELPEQTGSALITGPVTVKGSPQELVAAGGVGTI
jgi:hypothetical protein